MTTGQQVKHGKSPDEYPVKLCPDCRSWNSFVIMQNSFLDLEGNRVFFKYLMCWCCGWNNMYSSLIDKANKWGDESL